MYKLLIVEDEYASREGIKNILDWSSYNIEIVAEAANGIEGNEMALKHKPNIIITDICMNGITGLEMIYSLKKVLPETVFIVLTSYRDFAYMREAIKLKVFDYILKPIDIDEFKKVILRCVEELDDLYCQDPVKRDLMEQRSKLVKKIIKNGKKDDIIRDFDEYFNCLVKNVVDDNDKYTELASLIVKLKSISNKHDELFLNMFFAGNFDAESWKEVIENAILQIVDGLDGNSTKVDTAVLKIKQYIDENYNKNIDLDDAVEKNTDLNKYYVNNRFKKVYNESIGGYIQKLRLEKTKEFLLSDESIPVSAVAQRCGFINQKYFSVLFKKNFGLTPGEFRAVNKKQGEEHETDNE